MKLITFQPDADAEVTDAAEYHEARSLGLGSVRLEEVRRSLAHVLNTPEAYQEIGKRVRRKPFWRFPYNLVMRPPRIESESWHSPIGSVVHSAGENG